MGSQTPRAARSPAPTWEQQPARVQSNRQWTLRVVVTIVLTLCGGAPLLISMHEGRRLINTYDLLEPFDAPIQSVNSTKKLTEDLVGMTCANLGVGPCCASWNYDADDWWSQHPEFEVSYEDHSTFCFSKIQDQRKADFFRRIHNVQWNVSNCSAVLQRQQINSGWAASFGRVADSVWAAVHHEQPVQMTKHWEGMQWLYSTNDTDSWAYCPNKDMSCYMLPISPCPQVVGKNDDVRKTGGKIGSIEWLWLKQYAGRMRQHVRRKIHDMVHDEFPSVELPCTAMHVRRGDSGIPRRPFRRYAAISEYLEVGEIQPGGSIVLLTDDTSTIAEVQEHHPQYNWIYYADRPRNNGPNGGFDGHIPSNDPAYDFVVIQAELQLASQCTKFVHGSSSFADMVYDAMSARGTNVTRFMLDTTVSKEVAQANYTGDIKARGHLMLNAIQDAYAKDPVSDQKARVEAAV